MLLCYVLRMQAFCKDVLQQPAEKMPPALQKPALQRTAMRYYWLQEHGHKITPKLYFATLSPAKFAARYGSTEAAIKEWRQDWQQTAEGRLYGGEGADVDGDAPQKTKPSKPTVNVELEI